MRIGAYDCQTAFATTGSGSARWCVATRDGRSYFLKQFLTPVRPSPTTNASSALHTKQLARCEAFERRKHALYTALTCVIGDCVVPVTDFFAFDGRYYAVAEYIPTPFETFETLAPVTGREARELLFALARCLGRLHAQGVVHADLKPEHVLVAYDGTVPRVRLIDFDSGFLEDDPPHQPRDIEGDPVYLAPETFLCMTGEPLTLNRMLDTFAFGIVAHYLLTGQVPHALEPGYVYAYQAALAGAGIPLSSDLPTAYSWLIRKTLNRDPAERPDDSTLERLFAPPSDALRSTSTAGNGLSRYMRPRRP